MTKPEPSHPTPKEMAVLNEANAINFKLHWLREHPGKTRRDYNAGLKDQTSEVWQWRRAMGHAAVEAEEAAWLADHPGRPLPEHRCSMTPAEGAEYDAWKNPAKLSV
jgi:hypothetical protein